MCVLVDKVSDLRLQAIPRLPRVNPRVLGCPAQPSFLRPLLTQKTRPRKGSRASAHQHQIVLRELERVAGGQDAADGKYLRTSAEVQTSDERIYLCATVTR